jgi:DNA-binding XRE family transcriptional regulator
MSRLHLHNRVRERRKAAGGLTQQELACLVGVTRQSIIAVERGRCRPGVDLALRIARALSCQVEDLFEVRQDGAEAVSCPAARPPA